MSHAAEPPSTPTWSRTIPEAEIQAAVNHLDDRFDLTKKEVDVIDQILHRAAHRIDAPVL